MAKQEWCDGENVWGSTRLLVFVTDRQMARLHMCGNIKLNEQLVSHTAKLFQRHITGCCHLGNIIIPLPIYPRFRDASGNCFHGAKNKSNEVFFSEVSSNGCRSPVTAGVSKIV